MPVTPPLPDAEARAVSARLQEVLRARIEAAGGCLPFDAFMEAALYEPGLGYYSNGLTPFGEAGDFITAPESGSLFGRCLARSLQSVLAQLPAGDVLELGAGTGTLAVDLLRELEALGSLPERYFILERSAAMRGLQQQSLDRLDPGLSRRVAWLEAPPAHPFSGVVLGNEVVDALPVKRFCRRAEGVMELGVGRAQGRLVECERAGGAELEERVGRLAEAGGWPQDYCSELCPALPAWTRDLAERLERGLLLLIDYGYARAEYYHPQRTMGTLMCHYRHQAHGDPVWFPGLQDITAFVDFTAVAEAVTDAGLRLQGFSSQAQFLVACGIDRLLGEADSGDLRRFLALSNEAKRLLLPGEMGERFKVIGASRSLDRPVTGFGSRDLRSRL
ncbi:MAG: SAM-dependent methyltransferase [Gammaproteobacteria bacterium]|jgi:SAM-dependent MidA family methyltransferase